MSGCRDGVEAGGQEEGHGDHLGRGRGERAQRGTPLIRTLMISLATVTMVTLQSSP